MDKLSSNDLAVIRTDLAKERNRLAAERTLMAWIRTSLSMITFGFGIDRFFKYLKHSDIESSVDVIGEERILGFSLISLGIFALIVAIINHWQTLKNLEQEKFRYLSQGSLGIIVAVILVFIGLASYIPMFTDNVNLIDLLSLDSPLVQNFASLTVFIIMLALGVSLSVQDLLSFWKQPLLLGRSLFAIVIIPPILVALTLFAVDLPETSAIALVLMVASPGPALLTRRTSMAGANLNFVLNLQITLALLAIVVTPLILKFFSLLFVDYQVEVSIIKVLKQVAFVQFAPLIIGILIRSIWVNIADNITMFLKTIADILFAVLGLLLLLLSLNIIPALGVMSLLVAIVLSVIGLLIGQLLAIGYEPGIQSGIAVTVIARNVGLAIFIALANGQYQVAPIIVGLLIVGILVGFPYSIFMKKKVVLTLGE